MHRIPRHVLRYRRVDPRPPFGIEVQDNSQVLKNFVNSTFLPSFKVHSRKDERERGGGGRETRERGMG